MSTELNRRRHEEARSGHRTEAQRDRDRILYCSAFQRLAGITQIASAETGPLLHNRLTHSLKVAQVARRLAEKLRLDEDAGEVCEAAALAHDLGHPPFGHVAEVELNSLARTWGGFEGNAQSFRIVNALAIRSSRYRGLNLTARVLDGILKYPWLRKDAPEGKEDKWGAYQSEKPQFDWAREGVRPAVRTVDAELMDWADDVTYAVHDLEDFYRVGLIPLDRLREREEQERFLKSFFDESGKLKKRLAGFTEDELREAMRFVVGDAFGDATPYRGTRRERAFIRSQTSFLIGWLIDAVSIKGSALEVERARQAEVAVLKELAWFYIIESPALATLRYGQQKLVRELHDLYVDAANGPHEMRQLFPAAQQDLLEEARRDEDRCRIATDFVAGLTEEMAFELQSRLTGSRRGSILDAAALASR